MRIVRPRSTRSFFAENVVGHVICTEIGCIRRSKFQPRAYVGAHNQHGGYGHSNGDGYNLLFTPVPTYSNDAGEIELGLPTQNSDALMVVVF